MRSRPPFRSAAAPLAALASGLLLAACGAGSEEEGDVTGDARPPAVDVRIEPVTVQPFTETFGAIGRVGARAGHVAALSAPAATRVTAVNVSVGDRVGRGDVLVELDRAALEAAAQGAGAAYTAAQRAHERAQRLAQEGIIPRKDVEQAAADLARTRADAIAAQRIAELATLRAPIAGVVTALNASLGASADVGQPLVEVTDPTALDIVLNVTPTEASRVRVGARVALAAGQSASGEALGTGTVASVAGTVDTATRGVAIRVAPTGTRRVLRVGETVFGEVEVAMRPRAITVPIEALVPEGEGFKVFVVDSALVAHATPVTVGARTATVAEITDGLAAGQRVVTYGAYGVDDSVKVVPARQAPRTPPAVPRATPAP